MEIEPIMAQPEFYAQAPMMDPTYILLLVLLGIWSLVWKGLALWRAARNTHKAWYVILLIVNTAGILDILYFFIWGKPKK